ncbi:ATP-binding protein [Pectinatus frisingensis]|uniref:ATP-binding protein n=1 Tax=Pectinatus frisingensis TaxID=865 RepID=UPI0018C55671|nr:ATP-binding protein [Pectinatus frisingensis]
MLTPLANADALRIGSVEFVSPDEVKVLLDIEAPHDIALNSGIPRLFPRINSYALIPNESGFIVTQIGWITTEKSQFTKQRNTQDNAIIELPYPSRKMSLNLLGILKEKISNDNKGLSYTFSRGIEMFPTVGDPVLLPTQSQLQSIVESGLNRRVDIGTSPLAGNAIVSIDPNRLFGRHLAVLGNTGSGKSCSVAGLIRWSIEAAQRELASKQNKANTRFIILDPNGEYTTTFSDLKDVDVRIYGMEKDTTNKIKQLIIPLWLWNTSEWVAFTQASSKTQKPTLIQALRTVRDNISLVDVSPSHKMRRYLRTLITILKIEISKGNPWAGGGHSKGFKDLIKAWESGLIINDNFSKDEIQALDALKQAFENFYATNTVPNKDWPIYSQPETITLLKEIEQTHNTFGGKSTDTLPIDADIPRPFSGDDFLKSIEANAELMNTSDYVETMLMRVKTLLSDSKLKPVISPDEKITLDQWLDTYICPSNCTNGSITIIDLSLIPTELTYIITSVLARMTLESLQRYRKITAGQIIPTILVMEEAHTFIKRYNSDSENGNALEMCTKVFEKIAREGRKFGLGLVISSQRPSELSPTVLSQCNSFLLHRISNDRDQELVNKLVPDTLRSLLRELPSLPSGNAILLGWASELPVMVKMNYLGKEHRPQSNDPEYWNSWIENRENIAWKNIANSWQQSKKPINK